jgi:hypothetical protein
MVLKDLDISTANQTLRLISLPSKLSSRWSTIMAALIYSFKVGAVNLFEELHTDDKTTWGGLL